MNKKPNIEVLLSTYNGDKYLEQQLNSILSQTGAFHLKISVRDDGSIDNTCYILRDYEQKHGIHVTYGKNIGLNASMMELVKKSEKDFDYFAFSDQDDVWSATKISEAIKAFFGCNDIAKPLLWSCMEELTNERLEPIGLMPYPKYLGDFYNAIIQNKTAGHTQVFNKLLRDIYVNYPPDKMYVYDWVLYIIASEFGKVLYCNTVCGKYRQHDNNAIGYDTNPIYQLSRRLKRLFNGDFRLISIQLGYIYEIFRYELANEHEEELKRFLNSRVRLLSRISYAFTTKIKRNTVFESFQFRVLYILGLYNEYR